MSEAVRGEPPAAAAAVEEEEERGEGTEEVNWRGVMEGGRELRRSCTGDGDTYREKCCSSKELRAIP